MLIEFDDVGTYDEDPLHAQCTISVGGTVATSLTGHGKLHQLQTLQQQHNASQRLSSCSLAAAGL